MADPIKLLIIDDEDLVRESLEMVLCRAGYDAKSVSSAISALDFLQTQSVDVILSDIVMPEMDGVAFIKELRLRNNYTPIITLTGGARVGQKNMSQQALEAGACQALRKPVNRNQLEDAIKQALL